tara:strand:+ start:832 stop:1131 length:300 start_codon:yes stop_codon:yes gene_type:complete
VRTRVEISSFGEILIAEATIHGTPLVGLTLKETKLMEDFGVKILGIWERGHFDSTDPDALLTNHTVLLLAGTESDFASYDEKFCQYETSNSHLVIIGPF